MADLQKTSTFPDKDYLRALAKHMKNQAKMALGENPMEIILVEAGRRMNWIADYLTDKNILWKKEKLSLYKLTLTGTNPEWNAIILDQCHVSPKKLHELFVTNPSSVNIFASAKFKKVAILVRFENDQYKVLDGMNRVIAAIRDGKTFIDAFIATPKGPPKPECEPHVIYDFLRPYLRKIHQDRKSLIIALRLLRKSYNNVDYLLRERFGPSRLRNEDLQSIIQEALKDK